MIYRYSLREPSFSLVKNNKKRIEGRLYKNTFRKINTNDIINFYNCKKESIMVKVINIRRYNSFMEMLDNENIKLFNPNSKNINDSLEIYRNIYNNQDEKNFGVIVFEIIKL